MTPARHLLATLSVSALLAGCGGTPDRPDAPQGSFRTEILPNGTKLFTYTLGVPAPDKRANGGDMPPPGARARLPDPHKSLQQMLEQNRYCRDGYVTLEQYRMGMQQVVRGECRDDATGEDRQRFSAQAQR